MLAAVMALITVGVFIYQRYYAPKPDVENNKKIRLGDFNLPRADEGVPIPLFWGKVRIRSPIVIWAGQFETEPIEDHDITVGHAYRLGMHLLLGAPGSREGSDFEAQLWKFWIGEKRVWPSALVQGDPVPATGPYGDEGSGVRPYVYMGATSGGADNYGNLGKPQGFFQFLPGSPTQTLPTIVVTQLDSDGVDTTLAPAYRNQCVVCLYGGPNLLVANGTKGALVGSTPSLEPYSFEVFARSTTTSLGAAVGVIGEDANPINILYDILTNGWSRLGLSTSQIDTTTFLAAAQTLATEEHGMSLVISSQLEAREAIDLILSQIDATLFEDPATGKYKVKLIRDDYTLGSMPLYNTDNIVEVANYSTSTWNESINQVRIVYTSRAKRYQDRVAIAQDQAVILANGGKIRSREIRYPGCTTEALANKLASRDLRGLSLPLARVRLVVNRDAYTARPGDVIRWTWPDWGITNKALRVLKYDTGTLDNNRIVLDCVEDRFAYDFINIEAPEWQPLDAQDPWLPTVRIAEESPWWFAYRAQVANRTIDPDVPHGYYLLKNRTDEGVGTSIAVDISLDAAETFNRDTISLRRGSGIAFPPTFEVETAYARNLPTGTQAARDTTTGLRIKNLVGWTPIASVTVGDVTAYGAALLRINDEIIAYELATDLGGGVWHLENISRGMVDTVPQAHAVDDTGFVLYSGTTAPRLNVALVGNRGLDEDDEVTARATTYGRLGADAAAEEADQDTFTVTGRAMKPLTVASLLLNGSRDPDPLEEEGVLVAYFARNRLVTGLRFPFASPDSLEDGAVFDVYAQKGEEAEQLIANDVVSITTAGTLSVGAAGHGTIDVKVRAVRDGYSSHFDNALSVFAYPWRNLLLNPRFDSGSTTAWEEAAGDIVSSTSGNGLGGGGYYAAANTNASTDIRQVRDVTGYLPRRMRALLDIYARNLSADADDTLAVELASYSAADVQQDVTSYAATAQATATWSKISLGIATLDVDTAKLRARFQQAAVTDTGPSTVVTEAIMRLGQFTDQLLANPSFESGLTSWTASVGTATVETTTPYIGTQYVRGGASPGSTYYQEVAIPAGYEIGSTVVLEVARMHDASGDTGVVTVQVRDSGGSVLATADTGSEDISPTNVWVRRRIYVDTVDGAVNVRVLFTSSAASGTANACYDDFDLRIHKHLDPDTEHTYDFTTAAAKARIAQYLPHNLDYFDRAFPDVALPDKMFFVGSDGHGRLGTEPLFTVVEGLSNAPFFGGRYTGLQDVTNNPDAPVTYTDTALEFPFTADGGVICSSNTFCNFTSADDFTILVAFKGDPPAGGNTRDLISRRSASRGWDLAMDGDGIMYGEILGAGGSVSVTHSADLNDGAHHMIAMVHDATANTLRVVSKSGSSSSSTTSAGEFSVDGVNMLIGDGQNDPWRGQIARVWIWGSVVATADLQSMMTHGNSPHADLSQTRTGTIVIPTAVGTAAGGVQVARFAADQFAYGYVATHAGTTSAQPGVVIQDSASIANLIAHTTHQDLTNTTTWFDMSTTGLNRKYGVGPEGLKRSAYFSSTSSGGLQMRNIPIGGDFKLRMIWFAKADTSHSANIVFTDDNDVVKATSTYTVNTTWTMHQIRWSSWDDATTNCRVRFAGSNDGTSRQIEICGPFYAGQNADYLVGIPMGLPDGSSTTTSWSAMDIAVSMPAQFNNEGEVVVTGFGCEATPTLSPVILNATNGTNNNDRRQLSVGALAELVFDHYTGAASNTASETAAQSWNDLTTGFEARGRWNRTGLLDAANAFAGAMFGDEISDPADYDRTATWTAGTAAVDVVRIGGGAPMSMAVTSVILRAREEILPE